MVAAHIGGAEMDVKAVKDALNTHVKLAGSDADYLFTGYIFRRGQKGFIHQADLQDVNCGHCIVIANLDNVEGIKTERI